MPASVHGVAFEDAGQLIQVYRKSAEIRYHAVSQQRLKLIGQDVVALPVPFPERGDHTARGLCSAVRVLLKGGQNPVAEGLQAIVRRDRPGQPCRSGPNPTRQRGTDRRCGRNSLRPDRDLRLHPVTDE